jgi:hypothetical protein
MSKLVVMTPTKEINQTEPLPVEEIRELLRATRPYDVAHRASEVMGQLWGCSWRAISCSERYRQGKASTFSGTGYQQMVNKTVCPRIFFVTKRQPPSPTTTRVNDCNRDFSSTM